jgi:hypothetical protein
VSNAREEYSRGSTIGAFQSYGVNWVARRSWNFSCGDGVHYSALGAPGEACGAAWRARSAGSGGHVEAGERRFGSERDVSVGWQFERRGQRFELGVCEVGVGEGMNRSGEGLAPLQRNLWREQNGGQAQWWRSRGRGRRRTTSTTTIAFAAPTTALWWVFGAVVLWALCAASLGMMCEVACETVVFTLRLT